MQSINLKSIHSLKIGIYESPSLNGVRDSVAITYPLWVRYNVSQGYWNMRLNLSIISTELDQIIPICPIWVNGSSILDSFLFSYKLLWINQQILLCLSVNDIQNLTDSQHLYCQYSSIAYPHLDYYNDLQIDIPAFTCVPFNLLST
jgi:hypothetical protein